MQMCNVWSESLTQVNLLSLFINMNKFLVLACVVGVALAMPGGKGGSKGGKGKGGKGAGGKPGNPAGGNGGNGMTTGGGNGGSGMTTGDGNGGMTTGGGNKPGNGGNSGGHDGMTMGNDGQMGYPGLCLDSMETTFLCTAGTAMADKMSQAADACMSGLSTEMRKKKPSKGKPGKPGKPNKPGMECPSVDEIEGWFVEAHESKCLVLVF